MLTPVKAPKTKLICEKNGRFLQEIWNMIVYEQIAGRVQIVSDENALGLILKLYGSPSLGNELPGATASDERLPGGLRRFCTLHTQLEMNYDLRAMEPVAIATLLPEEFSSWVDGQPTKKKPRKSSVRKRATKSLKVRAKRKTR